MRLPISLPCGVVAGLLCALTLTLRAQEHAHPAEPAVPLQPLAQQARRIQAALQYLGQPLPTADLKAINDALALHEEAEAVARIQQTLDAYVLASVHINPESRVKVDPGPARRELAQGGTRLFLVKVFNDAGVTTPLAVRSPNSGRVFVPSRNSPEPRMELTNEEVRDRWADIALYDKSPMRARLSGLGIEYLILQIYSRDRGERSRL